MAELGPAGFSQVYGKAFARVYSQRFGFFSERVSPALLAFLAQDSTTQSCPRELLDVCCGAGHLAKLFVQKGYNVLGLDLSPDMIEYARANNPEAVARGSARFMVADATEFHIERPVPFAVSLFDALNHLPSLAALASCLRCVWESLSLPGLFVFDLNTPLGLERWNGMNVQDSEDAMLVTRGMYARGMERAFTSITGFVRNDDGSYQRFAEQAYNTVFDLSEVKELVRRIGFSDCYIASASDLRVAVEDPQKLDRAFFVARKA